MDKSIYQINKSEYECIIWNFCSPVTKFVTYTIYNVDFCDFNFLAIK